jgi:hypothetical protein
MSAQGQSATYLLVRDKSANPCADSLPAQYDVARRVASLSFNRERHEPNVRTGPPRMLDSRALVAAGGAASTAA